MRQATGWAAAHRTSQRNPAKGDEVISKNERSSMRCARYFFRRALGLEATAARCILQDSERADHGNRDRVSNLNQSRPPARARGFPMNGASSRCCNSSNMLVGLDANVARPMRRHGHALATDCSDQPLGKTVLPRRARHNVLVADTHGS